MSATSPSRSWLYGPAPDLLLGCGLVYLLALGLQAAVGADLALYVPGGVLVLLFSLPHYGATLIRVYENPTDRHRYWLFAIPVSFMLVMLLVAGLQRAWLGSLILTVYLTWSPWHYSGQNYGLFLMLAGRRGVVVTPLAKRLLHLSFVFSYALTFLALHGVEKGANYAPVSYGATVYSLLPLGIGGSWSGPLVAALGLAYVGTLVAAIALLLRAGSLAALAPSLGLAATQALWFSIPVLARYWGLGADSVLLGVYSGYGFLWVAAVHAVQYLWVTTYYAKRAGTDSSPLRFLGKAALAGFAIWTVPGLILAPDLLGDLPYESGLAVLIASVVNIHHFVLDGVIWKLRDGRIARVLLRTQSEEFDPGERVVARRWPARLVWAAGVVCVAISLVSFWESEFGFARALARGDLERAERAERARGR